MNFCNIMVKSTMISFLDIIELPPSTALSYSKVRNKNNTDEYNRSPLICSRMRLLIFKTSKNLFFSETRPF